MGGNFMKSTLTEKCHILFNEIVYKECIAFLYKAKRAAKYMYC